MDYSTRARQARAIYIIWVQIGVRERPTLFLKGSPLQAPWKYLPFSAWYTSGPPAMRSSMTGWKRLIRPCENQTQNTSGAQDKAHGKKKKTKKGPSRPCYDDDDDGGNRKKHKTHEKNGSIWDGLLLRCTAVSEGQNQPCSCTNIAESCGRPTIPQDISLYRKTLYKIVYTRVTNP